MSAGEGGQVQGSTDTTQMGAPGALRLNLLLEANTS
jgi:hypothetical protein